VTSAADPAFRARKWLANQGYELEYATARAFREADFLAVQGQTYRDLMTDKTREIDIVAYPLLRTRPIDTVVIVECKSSPDPWIVRMARFEDDQLRWRPIASDLLADYLMKDSLIARWFRVSDPTAFEVVAAKEGRKPGEDAAFAALSQVVSSARGTLARQTRGRAALVYPVIVLDAPLFSLWYDDKGEERLEPIEWARILWSGSNVLPAPVAIDLVTRAVTVARAESIRDSLGAMIELLPAGRSFIRPGAVSF